jgi:Secretion system C-terminal sorting domain
MTQLRKYNFFILVLFLSEYSFCQNWVSLNNGIGCFPGLSKINDLYADNEEGLIYLNGDLSFAENGPYDNCEFATSGTALWDGYRFTNLNGGLYYQQGYHITKYKGHIYASAPIFGTSLSVGPNLSRWNGVGWDKLLDAPDGRIFNSKVINDTLWLMGYFNKCCGDIDSPMLCKFDGENFYPVEIGEVAYPLFISGMEYLNNTLYVGGDFTNIVNGINTGVFSRYYNNGFHSVEPTFSSNGGLNYDCLAAYKNELYLGGWMRFSGEDTIRYLLKYDGEKFTQVGTELLNQQPVAFKVYKDELYILGMFTQLGDREAQGLIKWNGEKYTVLNTDTIKNKQGYFSYPAITCLDILNDTLYIAGNLYTIGLDTMNCVAKYNHALSDPIQNPEENSLTLYPNPTGNEITIGYSLNGLKNVSFSIYDIRGRLIIKIEKGNKPAGKYVLEKIDISKIPSGIYIVQMLADNHRISKKLFKIE